MNKGKYISSIVFIITISLICSPSQSIARTLQNQDDSKKMMIEPAPKKPALIPEKFKTIDDKMLIKPKYNCDPKMLTPGDTTIDRDFLLIDAP